MMLISEKPGTVLTSTTWGTPFVKDEVHPRHPAAIQVAVYRYSPVLNVRGQVRIDIRRGLLSTLACILRFVIEEGVVADDFRDRQKTRSATRLEGITPHVNSRPSRNDSTITASLAAKAASKAALN